MTTLARAVDWAIRHEDGESPDDPAFLEWAALPGNRALYDEAKTMCRRLDSIDPHHETDVEDLIAKSSLTEDVAS